MLKFDNESWLESKIESWLKSKIAKIWNWKLKIDWNQNKLVIIIIESLNEN